MRHPERSAFVFALAGFVLLGPAPSYVFSADGEPLDTMGGPGEGPGEFLRMSLISFIEGRLVVTDTRQRRFTSFDLDGELLDTRRSPDVSFDPPWTRGTVVPAVRGLGLVVPALPNYLLSEHPVRPQYIVDSLGVVVDTLPPDTAGERSIHLEYESGATYSRAKPLYQGNRQKFSKNGRYFAHGRPTARGVAISLWDLAEGSRHEHVLEVEGTPVPRAWSDSVESMLRESLTSHGTFPRASSTGPSSYQTPSSSTSSSPWTTGRSGSKPTFEDGERELWYMVHVVEGSHELVELPRDVELLVRLGDHVWGRVQDDLGVDILIRLHLQRAGGPP